MAKKRNVVKRAKGELCLLTAAMAALGIGLTAHAVLIDTDSQKQEALIHTANIYLEDKLYIRAVKKYQEALSTYDTEHNLAYEEQLLEVYRTADMREDYYDLIDRRINQGRAALEEYKQRAKSYIEEGDEREAIKVLQDGIRHFEDETLVSLYESVRYRYSPVTTAYTSLLMPSSDWYIPAYDGEQWGYIGLTGRTALEFAYEEATRFSGGYAVAKIDGVYTLIDKQGYWNARDKQNLDEVTAISGWSVIGVKDGKYGIYTREFSLLGEEMYDGIIPSDNGLFMVKKDGKWALLDENLKQITDFCFIDVAVNSRGQAFGAEYALVSDKSGYYLIDQKGEACFDNRFPDAKGSEGGLLAVSDSSGKWGFADEKGNLVIECQYEEAYSFSDGLASVKYAGKWGYINQYQTWIIEPQFGEAYPFLDGSGLVKDELGNYRILSLEHYELFQ